MTNLHAELKNHIALKERLLMAYPDLSEDDPALVDSLEGATNLQEAIVSVLRSADADRMMIEAIALRIDELCARSRRLEERHDKKREAARAAMEDAGLKRIPAPDFTVSLANGRPKVIVTDEALIPAAFMVQPEAPPKRPDRALIAAALNAKREVPGTVLSNASTHLVIKRS